MASALENILLTKTVVAGGSIEPHRFVDTDVESATAQTSNTGKVLGVMSHDSSVASGDATPVATHGTAIVEASAAISKGDYVTATTGGKAVSTTTSGDQINGVALDAAGADGDLIEVLLVNFHHK